jgi:hypothetical protein
MESKMNLINTIPQWGALCLISAFLFIASACGVSKDDIKIYQKALDVQEIQNVMSRHAWYYSSGQHKREVNELFALDEPDVSWGSDDGWWVGKDTVVNYYVTYFDTFRALDFKAFIKNHPQVENKPENYGAGTLMFHTNSTPVIEIAGDGKTAKGIWYSVGQVTQTPGGKQSATYMWERYGVDFIKKDGKWKIWHFIVMTDWSAGAGQSWAEDDHQGQGAPAGQGAPGGQGSPAGQGAPGMQGASGGMPGGFGVGMPAATVPNTEGRRSQYAPPTEYLKIPVPYNTFSETFSYGPPKK